MPADDSLKRLGGGRWETRDGRFAIEPQSGTWVVVDSSQSDDLGLPLVRGPFGSLTAAREAIEAARSAGPVESPLADRIRQAQEAEARKPKAAAKPAKAGTGGKAGKAGRLAEPAAPEPPPEPKWLRDLGPAERRQAHELIQRLEKLGIGESEAIARAEIARDQPAVVRLAIERSVRKALVSRMDPAEAVRAAVGAILGGRDSELGVRWSLVDDRGRRVDTLDLSD